MTGKTRIGIIGLCLVIALLTGITSGAGLFMRGDGSFEPVTNVRGEHYEMATTGVYAYNAVRVVAEGIGWDIFTQPSYGSSRPFHSPGWLNAFQKSSRGAEWR